MEDAKEKKLNEETLGAEFEKKIIEETYKSIEDYDNCALIAVEYSKLNTLKAKIRGIFKSIKSFLNALIKREVSIEKTQESQGRTYKNYKLNDFDYDSKTHEIPKEMINNSIKNKYNIKEDRQINGKSGPIFYNLKQEIEYSMRAKQENNTCIKQDKKYIDIPNIKGDIKEEELEI